MLSHKLLTTEIDESDLLHFLRVFLNELLGRYFHLQQFAEQSKRESGGKPPALLLEYSTRIQANAIDLIKWSPTLDLPKEKLQKKRLLYVFPYLIERSREFQRLHRTLRWFSEPWPEAELFQFLSRIFKENQLESDFQKLNGSIVYNDEFNFVTYDVGYVRKPSPRLGLNLWALPKSESTNPLLWPVLVHEVAHSYFKEKDIFGEIKGLTDIPWEQSLLQRWAIELNADLFGYNLLGPAYLYSLIYFSVFFVPGNLHHPILPNKSDPGLSTDRSDLRSLHPPPATRVKFLLQEVLSSKLGKLDSYGFLEESLNPITKLFFSRLELDNLERNFDPEALEETVLPEEKVNELWERLKSFQLSKVPKEPILSDEQLKNTSMLTTRLKEKFLAGSILDYGNSSEVRQYIDLYKKAVAKDDVNETADFPDRAIRESALSYLNETPARMIDIINAGWTSKVYNLQDGYEFHHVIGDDIGAKLSKIRNSLVEPARQLQKSIQVALIFSSFRSVR